jgi:hypothetical protein
MLVVAGALLWPDQAPAQQERIRISDIATTENPFDPRSGQKVTITGKVEEFVGESEVLPPLVSALIEGKIEVPVAVTHLESPAPQDEDSALLPREWGFSLTWDGMIPWDLFPQGRFTCMITAESTSRPGLKITQRVRLYIQPAPPPPGQ